VHEDGIHPVQTLENGRYDAVIMAVAHRQFAELGIDAIRALGKPKHVLYDLKYIFKTEQSDLRL
jgi:UDP-N-acetyl-D-galactosamine dehydrogenase